MSDEKCNGVNASADNVWRCLHHVILSTELPHVEDDGDLPEFVWSSFNAFRDRAQSYESAKCIETTFVDYQLARPLIGSSVAPEGYLVRSPVFTRLTDTEKAKMNCHHFLQYVALLKALRNQAITHDQSISRSILDSSESYSLCHIVLRDSEGTTPDYPGEVKLHRVSKPESLCKMLEPLDDDWPKSDGIDISQIHLVEPRYVDDYAKVCAPKVLEISAALHDSTQDALVARWLYQTNTSLLVFPGIDPDIPYHYDYPWGGVWFLTDKLPSVESIFATQLLVRECFQSSILRLRMLEAERLEEMRINDRKQREIQSDLLYLLQRVKDASERSSRIKAIMDTTGNNWMDLYHDPEIAKLFIERTVLDGHKVPHKDENMTLEIWSAYRKHLESFNYEPLIKRFLALPVTTKADSQNAFRLLKRLIQRPHHNTELSSVSSSVGLIRPVQLAVAAWLAIELAKIKTASVVIEVGSDSHKVSNLSQLASDIDHINQPEGKESWRSQLPHRVFPYQVLEALAQICAVEFKPKSKDPDVVRLSQVVVSLADGERAYIELRIECNGVLKPLQPVDESGGFARLRSCIKDLGLMCGSIWPKWIRLARYEALADLDEPFVVGILEKEKRSVLRIRAACVSDDKEAQA